jgi:hypothetical protein
MNGLAFPLSVDGIEIVASLERGDVGADDIDAGDLAMLDLGNTRPWTALAIGTTGSLAANVATAGPA